MTKKQVRVNIRSVVNHGGIRNEMRNNRKVMIVPSATLPDDVIMNGIMYPADEIEKSYASLNRTPAPMGHPFADGKFISARDPEGINHNWVGAWNENARRENGRVLLDKVIDVEVAQRSDQGKSLLDALDLGEPVHTSTGLICYLESAEHGADYDYIARDIEFDHDAILIGEEGAATPEQGVGMMINSAGEDIEVINSALEDAERDLDWAADMAARAIEKMERAPMLERFKAALRAAFQDAYPGDQEREPTAKGDSAMADDKQFNELSAKVEALTEVVNGIGDLVKNTVSAAVKPLTDNLEEIQANQKAEADAKRSEAVTALVNTGHWTEEDLKDIPLPALSKLVNKAKTGKAAGLNSADGGGAPKDEFEGYDLNANMKEAS